MVSPSVRFVLDQWYEYTIQLTRLGFTHTQARHLASLKQRYYAGRTSS